MALSTASRNAGADALVDLVDVGSGTPTLELGTSAAFTTIPLIFNLATPAAFAAAAGGSAAFTGAPIVATATASGTATHKRLKDRDGNVITSVDEIVDAIMGLIDVGSGTPVVEIGDTGLASVYISYNLDTPAAFGDSSSGIATANGYPKTAAASATGTGTDYQIKDRDGTVVLSDTLAASVNFTNGQNYTFNSFTYTTTPYSQVLASSFAVVNGEDYNLNAISAYTQPAS